MVDKTREDFALEHRIKAVEDKAAWVKTHENRIRVLEGEVTSLKSDNLDLKARLSRLEPLERLAGVADQLHKLVG